MNKLIIAILITIAFSGCQSCPPRPDNDDDSGDEKPKREIFHHLGHHGM